MTLYNLSDSKTGADELKFWGVPKFNRYIDGVGVHSCIRRVIFHHFTCVITLGRRCFDQFGALTLTKNFHVHRHFSKARNTDNDLLGGIISMRGGALCQFEGDVYVNNVIGSDIDTLVLVGRISSPTSGSYGWSDDDVGWWIFTDVNRLCDSSVKDRIFNYFYIYP